MNWHFDIMITIMLVAIIPMIAFYVENWLFVRYCKKERANRTLYNNRTKFRHFNRNWNINQNIG